MTNMLNRYLNIIHINYINNLKLKYNYFVIKNTYVKLKFTFLCFQIHTY